MQRFQVFAQNIQLFFNLFAIYCNNPVRFVYAQGVWQYIYQELYTNLVNCCLLQLVSATPFHIVAKHTSRQWTSKQDLTFHLVATEESVCRVTVKCSAANFSFQNIKNKWEIVGFITRNMYCWTCHSRNQHSQWHSCHFVPEQICFRTKTSIQLLQDLKYFSQQKKTLFCVCKK